MRRSGNTRNTEACKIGSTVPLTSACLADSSLDIPKTSTWHHKRFTIPTRHMLINTHLVASDYLGYDCLCAFGADRASDNCDDIAPSCQPNGRVLASWQGRAGSIRSRLLMSSNNSSMRECQQPT